MKRKIRKGLVGLGLLLPSATGLMLFYFIPFCMSVYYSFSKVSGRFVPAGFSNYDSVLGSEAFQVAFRNTFAFLGIGLIFMLITGYLLALLIRHVAHYSSGLSSLGITALFSLIYIVQIGQFAPALMLPAVCIIAATVAVTLATSIAQMRVSSHQMEFAAKENGKSFAMINGVQKIKLAGAEKRAFAQ